MACRTQFIPLSAALDWERALQRRSGCTIRNHKRAGFVGEFVIMNPFFQKVLNVPSQDPDDARRRRLLNILLLVPKKLNACTKSKKIKPES